MFKSRKLSYSYPSTTGQFNADYADLPLKKLLVNIPISQTGSGTPSPDNVRDFVGFSDVNISRTGINIWDEIVESGRINAQTGQNATADTRIRSKNYIPVVGGETYYFKTPISVFVFCYDANKEFILNPNGETNNYITVNGNSAILPANCKYIRLVPNATYGTTYNHDISINYPSTDTSYHAYTGNTYSISFGQTVYSANLDVLRGKLYLTHELKTIDENSDIQIANGIFTINDFFDIENDATTDSRLCNIYQRARNRSVTSAVMDGNPDYSFCCRSADTYSTRIMIKDLRFDNVNDYKTWLSTNPVKIAVKLATPIEIPLGGIDIKTLQGINNIFADIGTVETQCIRLGN